MSSQVFNIGISGGGPRGMLLAPNIAAVLSTRPDLKTLKINITVFEKQPAKDLAGGHAWQHGCDAPANTGIPGIPTGFENVDPRLANLLDLAGRTAEKALNERVAIQADLELRNPAAAAMFEKSFLPNGTFETKKASVTRGFLGDVLRESISKALDYIRSDIPQLTVDVRPGHEVLRPDFSDPQKPQLIVRKVGEQSEQAFIFDMVIHAQGTAVKSAVSEELAAKTYSDLPNHEAVKTFLTRNDMLDSAGNLKPGKRIVISGESLSALDFHGLLLAFLPCFVRDQSNAGYHVDKTLASKYQGAFTFVSRGSGRPAPPRLAHTENWRGIENPILTTTEMHALRLVPGRDWATIAWKCLKFNIADTLGKLPSQINADLGSSRAYMDALLPQTEDYLDNPDTLTEAGLVRSALVSFFHGRGFENDPEQAEKDLEDVVPITRLGRGVWGMVASAGVEMSEEGMSGTPASKTFFQSRDMIRWHAAASPAHIQYSLNLLYQAGVAVHQSGNFNDFALVDDGVALRNERYNVLFAPKVISRDADTVVASLGDQVQKQGGVPVFVKGRYYKTAAGRLINAIDTGVGGWGIPSAGGAGGMSEERWSGDIVDFGSANLWAKLAANQVLMQAFLKANNSNSTIHDVDKRVLPSEDDYEDENKRLEPVWKGFRQKLACIEVCEKLAGNDRVKHRKMATQILATGTRQVFIKEHRSQVTAAEKKMGEFATLTLERYEGRFPDFTTYQLDEMWKLILPADED